MILYEVALSIQEAHAEAFLRWLREHVAEIVEIEGFLGAEVWEQEGREGEKASEPRRQITVHYRLRDQGSLDHYLRDHAPRLRKEGQDRFGGRFEATRRILALKWIEGWKISEDRRSGG